MIILELQNKSKENSCLKSSKLFPSKHTKTLNDFPRLQFQNDETPMGEKVRKHKMNIKHLKIS